MIVLTGFEESRSFVRNPLNNGAAEFYPAGPITRYLVFNDGAFKIPCDDEVLFSRLVEYQRKDTNSKSTPLSKASRVAVLPDIPAGADMFSATDIPAPPPEVEDEEDSPPDDWVGTQDDAEDGVGQL